MENKGGIPLQQNLNIIQPLLENLSVTYQSWIKYINHSGAYICTPVNKQQCNFCRLIRDHPVGYRRCRETAEKCVYLDPKKHHLFPCHAGLYVLAVPLQGEQGCVGALATGEIKIIGIQDAGRVLQKVADLKLHEGRLLAYFEEIPVKKRENVLLFGKTLYVAGNCFLRLGATEAKSRQAEREPIHPKDLRQVISGCVEEISGSRSTATGSQNGLTRSQQFVKSAVEYIAKNYMKPLTLEQAARQVHLSPAYFSCLFSREQGQTFTEFLTATRLEKAKELLRTAPALPISDIAGEVGYEDVSYFSRVFKKKIGTTPAHYRKKREYAN